MMNYAMPLSEQSVNRLTHLSQREHAVRFRADEHDADQREAGAVRPPLHQPRHVLPCRKNKR